MNPKNHIPIAIVTGLEHSGTTYLSAIIKCHPRVNSGFECGVLLADTPKDFVKVYPWYDWMLQNKKEIQWRITKQNMDQICDSKTWHEMYSKIIKYSPLFNGTKNCILDKTPAYMPILDKVLKKVDSSCLVTYKKIDFQYISYKKRGWALSQFETRYKLYMKGLFKALTKYPKRIMILNHYNLCKNTFEEIEKIFKFIKLDFSIKYFENDILKNLPYQKKLANFDYDIAIKELDCLSEEEKIFLEKISVDDKLEILSS